MAPRDLGVVKSVALIVGMQIGSGIFSSPGVILADVNSSGAALCVWFASGLLAWTGASSFAELGAAIPLNGGAAAYLQYSFGPLSAYLYSFTAITAVKPGSQAIIAIIFGEYLCRVLYHTAFSSSSEESVKAIPTIVVKLVSLGCISIVALLNIASNKAGTRTQVILTVAKVLALVAVALIGIVQLARGRMSDSLVGNIFSGSSTSPSNYALSMFSGLWAFDGFDQANYVAGEMKNTARDLPRTIHLSMLIVMLLFVVANISYLVVLPKQLVAQSNTVALDFGRSVLGPIGALVFALIVAASCLGAVNGSMYTSARLICVASKEGFLPKVFAKLHPKRQTPVNAILLQTVLTCLMIFFGDFKSLVVFFSICSWTFYLATVGSLLILRVREPDLVRPYKTWLITPFTFSTVAVFLVLMPIFSAPIEALISFAFIFAGFPLYYLTMYQTEMRQWWSSVRREGLSVLWTRSSIKAEGYSQAEQHEMDDH